MGVGSCSKRIIFVDYAKVIATVLVVFAHLYSTNSEERLYIYAFHMPFFYITSGLFHKNGSDLRKAFAMLIVPALIFMLIGIIWKVLRSNDAAILSIAISFLKGGRLPVNAPIWFLISLFYVKCIAYVYDKIPSKIWCTIIWLLLFFSFAYFKRRYLYISTAIMCVPFYYFGYHFRNEIKNLQENKFAFLLFAPLAVVCVLLTKLNGRVSVLGCSFGNAPEGWKYILFYFNAIIGSLSLLALCSIFVKPNSYIKLLSSSLISVVGLQFVWVSMFVDIFGYDRSYWISLPASIIIVVICTYLHKFVFSVLFEKIRFYLCGK